MNSLIHVLTTRLLFFRQGEETDPPHMMKNFQTLEAQRILGLLSTSSMKMIKKTSLGWGMVLLMTGCRPYDTQFDCPHGNGLGCTSLSTVSKLIDAHALDRKADLLKSPAEGDRVFIYFGDHKPSRLVSLGDL